MKVNINRHIFSIEPSKGSMVFSGTLTAVIFTIAIMFGFIPNTVSEAEEEKLKSSYLPATYRWAIPTTVKSLNATAPVVITAPLQSKLTTALSVP